MYLYVFSMYLYVFSMYLYVFVCIFNVFSMYFTFLLLTTNRILKKEVNVLRANRLYKFIIA